MVDRWNLDGLVVYKLVEDEASYTHLDTLLPGVSRPEVMDRAGWLAGEGFDPETGFVSRSYHSYVVETPEHRVLVDTCIGNGKSIPHRSTWNNKDDRRWMDQLEATGLRCEDIDYVLCTHLHVDHVGWNTRFEHGRWVPTFRNARHLIVEREFVACQEWQNLHKGDWRAEVDAASFRESVAPIFEAGQVDLVDPDFEFGEYFRFLPTPGHSAGHSAICAGRGADAAVFTGDLMHSPIQTAFPDTLMHFDDDREQAAKTRRAFLERFSGTETLVFSMHFPAPSVGYVKDWGDAFRFHAVGPS